MQNFKKYLAEFIGTLALVLFGCGVASLTGCEQWGGYIATALAFGFTIVAMAYSIGNVSGCHVNPAVSLAMLLTGQLDDKDFAGYVIAQFLGATVGAALLQLIFAGAGVTDATGALGSNGLAGLNGSIWAGLLVEILLTFFFVLTILGVTDSKAGHGHFGGLIIGLSLTLVHLLGIGLTGTSVNPARSFGPALISLFAGNSAPMGVLWIFIVAPLLGSCLAAWVYKVLKK